MPRSRPTSRPAPRRFPWLELPIWALVLIVPVVVDPSARESFTLPKLVLAEFLALVSIAFLSLGLFAGDSIDWTRLRRAPALAFALPLVAAAALSRIGCRYPHHWNVAFTSLVVAMVALVGWSLGLERRARRRLLFGIVWPGVLLAVIGILQFHDLFQPFSFEGDLGRRFGVTSLGGSAGDLGAFLVLPFLLAQSRLGHGGRWWWGVVAVLGYALALTQTITAIGAAIVGSAVLWGGRFRTLSRPVRATVLVALVLGTATVGYVGRHRLERKAEEIREGQWNAVFTGRFDGWRVALHLAREHPVTGVGHGAYRSEFAPARLALIAAGVPFYGRQHQAIFANAHCEPLEVAAEWGLVGLLALAWALIVLWRAIRARRRPLAWALLTALALLALGSFPFRLALVGYPALLALAWILDDEKGDE